MKELTTTWTGFRPLLMHNGELANPFNKFTQKLKELTGKKKKTESDYEEMARIEFDGGLYWTEGVGPTMPYDSIEACIRAGAKKNKLGKEVQASVLVSGTEPVSVDYRPENIKLPPDKRVSLSDWKSRDALYAKRELYVLQKGVKVTTNRIIRTRPMFPTGWSITFTLEYDETIMNEAALRRAMDDAGRYIGLGDWRPKFGRFIVI